MGILWLVPPLALTTFLLGILVWAIFKHFLTADVPSTLQHRFKFRFLHCVFLYVVTLGNILEKLKICPMPKFFRFLQDCMILRKDPTLVITNLHFGTIPVRLFQPKAPSSVPRRGIIFYHGGGGIFGGLDCYHSVCCFLARETDSVVLSIGYRLYPDHNALAMGQDCLYASIHFLKTLETYGVDPSRVLVCGESIGGSFAAFVTHALVNKSVLPLAFMDTSHLPRIRAQVLIYPFLQGLNFQLPSHQQNQNVPFLPQNFLMKCLCDVLSIDHSWKDVILHGEFIPPEMWRKYQKWLSDENIPKKFKNSFRPMAPRNFNEAAYLETSILFHPMNSPLTADDEIIAQLPEAFLVSCENDILRDDSLLFKKRLEDQGVPVTWYHVKDGFHASLILFDKKPFSFPCSLKIVNAVASYIKNIQ
ncbi:arylacetamide deacetylase-like 4 [Rhynchocyon petersi]